MEQFISGLIVSLLTQGAKKMEAVPISEDQIGRIRILTGALSIVAALLVSYLHGTLSTDPVISTVGSALSTYLMSILSYHGFIRD